MKPNVLPPTKPWLNHLSSSPSSLSARGMEIAVSPGQLPPDHCQKCKEQTNKDIPPLLAQDPLSFRVSRTPIYNEMTASTSSRTTARLWSIDSNRIPKIPQRSPLRYSRETTAIQRGVASAIVQPAGIDMNPAPQESQRSPLRYSTDNPEPAPITPVLTKSSRKVLQLTGSDPRFERVLPIAHQQLSQARSANETLLPDDSSSGSEYSQPGIETEQDGQSYQTSGKIVEGQQEEQSRWSRSSSAKSEKGVVQSSIYKLADYMTDAMSSVTSLSRRDHAKKEQARPNSQPTARQHVETALGEAATLRELLEQERVSYDAEMSHRVESKSKRHCRHDLVRSEPNLVPKPLALRPKLKTKHLSLDTSTKSKPSFFQTARESLEIGIAELTAPMLKSKDCNKPVEPSREASMQMPQFVQPHQLPRKQPPPASKATKKGFGTGKHPLKSPFPPARNQGTGSEPTGNSRGRRTSWTMRNRSSRATSPKSPKRKVISNKARRASGPDTPMPNSGLMSFLPTLEEVTQSGDGPLQNIITKIKKTVRFKTADEKKRESLKKSIVIVGVSDQSPDGRVAEWL